MARPEGFEPPAPRFVVWCSIQLSYGRGLRNAQEKCPTTRFGKGSSYRLQSTLARLVPARVPVLTISKTRSVHCPPSDREQAFPGSKNLLPNALYASRTKREHTARDWSAPQPPIAPRVRPCASATRIRSKRESRGWLSKRTSAKRTHQQVHV